MPARDPDLVEAILGITSWLDADGTLEDRTDDATDNDFGKSFVVIDADEQAGKATWNTGQPDLAAGDTISIHQNAESDPITWALLAYTAASAVTATGKITLAGGDDILLVFTLTQAFIDQLADLGSGKFAVRIVEDLQTALPQDFENELAEVDAVLSAGAAPARRAYVT